ncbi:MAG TPA: hypothetical protein VLF39_00160 [Candidatus Saccharimonadales bacterium]|nr:hypothetical protein [Candidatus Saccharimonadales bacterium]
MISERLACQVDETYASRPIDELVSASSITDDRTEQIRLEAAINQRMIEHAIRVADSHRLSLLNSVVELDEAREAYHRARLRTDEKLSHSQVDGNKTTDNVIFLPVQPLNEAESIDDKPEPTAILFDQEAPELGEPERLSPLKRAVLKSRSAVKDWLDKPGFEVSIPVRTNAPLTIPVPAKTKPGFELPVPTVSFNWQKFQLQPDPIATETVPSNSEPNVTTLPERTSPWQGIKDATKDVVIKAPQSFRRASAWAGQKLVIGKDAVKDRLNGIRDYIAGIETDHEKFARVAIGVGAVAMAGASVYALNKGLHLDHYLGRILDSGAKPFSELKPKAIHPGIVEHVKPKTTKLPNIPKYINPLHPVRPPVVKPPTAIIAKQYQYPWDWAEAAGGRGHGSQLLTDLGHKAQLAGHNVTWHGQWLEVDGKSDTTSVIKVLGRFNH